jgi:hypothetical protein
MTDIDPRIKIQVVADGEVHIAFTWTKEDLAQFALAFVQVCDGRMRAQDAKAVFRLRSKEGIDYLIEELQKARKKLYGKDGEK